MMELRDYQNAAVLAAYSYMNRNPGNPCIVVPTGGGKTAILAKICKDVSDVGRRAIIVSHVKELLEQARATLKRFDPSLDVGVYSAGLNSRETGSRITIAGIQSICNRTGEFDPFDIIVIDEAHLIPPDGEGRYQTFLKDCLAVNPKVRLIGLTATPFRTGSGMLCGPENLLNDIVYTIDVKLLIQRGFLSPLISKNGKHQADFSGVSIRGGEFVNDEVEKKVNTKDEIFMAVREILRMTEKRKSVLIFAASVDHAKNIQKCLQEQSGQEVGLITGSTDSSERLDIIDRFRGVEVKKNLFGDVETPLKYLVNVNVLTTGFDAPNIDCVAIMRPTMSPGLYVQMAGRGLRMCEGKTDCLVLDYGENILRHGCIDQIYIRKKGEKGTAPAKECPKCHEVVHLSTRICPDCGYEWTMERTEANTPRNRTKASDASILSGEKEEIETEVEGVSYYRWPNKKNPDGPPTLRVIYRTTAGDISEWVCPEHKGWAFTNFVRWYNARSDNPGIPSSVDTCVRLGRSGEFAKPVSLILTKNKGGRFWELKKAKFKRLEVPGGWGKEELPEI